MGDAATTDEATLLEPAADNAVEEAILSRRSIRGFRSDPVDPALIGHLLQVAARAPSGSNIQPWRAHVLTGAALDRIRDDLTAAYLADTPERPDYYYYPTTWRSPYIERRRATGWGLYNLVGIARGDQAAGKRQRARNYRFFGAPVGIVFVIDRDLERGSWLDYGMFLQNVMIAARGQGLDSCPQQSIANYPEIVARHLMLGAHEMIVCGMAIGFADPAELANRLVTAREPLDAFVTFHAE